MSDPTTAFGPQGPNYSLARPDTDPVVSGGEDTWFKPCSAPGAQDGTAIMASWLNTVAGNLRYLVREAGVTLNDSADAMVHDAIVQLINAAVSTGGIVTGQMTIIAVPE